MIGAVVTLYLLFATGLGEWTLAACVAATACALSSKLIFRGRSATQMVDWPPLGP
jgi:hypothetical protein